jgi:DNA-3-methyladenine glycosylase I
MSLVTDIPRCAWVTDDPLYIEYHDREWGVPLHDDTRLFELLNLEGAQTGLSWITILRKRATYREAFNGFDAKKIAQYDDRAVQRLLTNPGIVRNRLKILATIQNARSFLAVQQEFGSFDAYIWSFVGNQPIINAWTTLSEVPTQTEVSCTMSRDLQRRQFKFVGPTICYAFMQACGMVNDHTTNCHRYIPVQG